jgi:CRP-like cAMP-binding protein
MISQELMQGLGLFSGLNQKEQNRVAALSRELRFDRDAVIFKEGTEAEDLYVLLEGRVALRFHIGMHPLSTELTTDVIEPGEIMAWSALVPPGRLTASGVCLEPVRVLAIAGAALRKLLDDDPHIGYAVMTNLAEVIATRLRDTRLRLMQEIGQAEETSGR